MVLLNENKRNEINENLNIEQNVNELIDLLFFSVFFY